MHFNDLLTKLTYLTKKNNITNSEIGKVIGLDRQAMSGRAARNSTFKSFEIEKIEKYYNVDLSGLLINSNSLKRRYDDTFSANREQCKERINIIKNKNNLSNLQMSVLLNISENELEDILTGKTMPDLNILSNIKKNFEVSVDWILFGE